jgi:hypothetical protein
VPRHFSLGARETLEDLSPRDLREIENFEIDKELEGRPTEECRIPGTDDGWPIIRSSSAAGQRAAAHSEQDERHHPGHWRKPAGTWAVTRAPTLVRRATR